MNIKPGDEIKRRLAENGWQQADLAFVMGRPATLISRLANGRQRITPRMALLLAAAFGNLGSEWMALETTFRLAHHRTNTEKLALIRERSAQFTKDKVLPKVCTKCGQLLSEKNSEAS